MVPPPKRGIPPLEGAYGDLQKSRETRGAGAGEVGAEYRACVSCGGDARVAILGAGSGNRLASFRFAGRHAPRQPGMVAPPSQARATSRVEQRRERVASTVEGCRVLSDVCPDENSRERAASPLWASPRPASHGASSCLSGTFLSFECSPISPSQHLCDFFQTFVCPQHRWGNLGSPPMRRPPSSDPNSLYPAVPV